MKLADLEPEFLRYENRSGQAYLHDLPRDGIAEADGIMFLCPKCYCANHGPVGTHHIICWRRGRVPDDALPGPGRWEFTGTGFQDLSLVARSSSVQLTDRCKWHGFIRNGEVIDA